MRKGLCLVLAAVFVATATPALAELQNVAVGGELRIGYNAIINNYPTPGGFAVRWPALNGVNWLPGRPVGDMVSYFLSGGNPASVRGNGLGIVSPYAWDDDSNALEFTEMRTRLNFTADFTNEVRAFVEFDSYEWWGEDFRSNYLTGIDARQNDANDDVTLYQGYIEANNMFGTPLRARIGRQELMFGREWLVGNKDFGPWFVGRSFDALRLTYATDAWSVDAWASILAESGVAEEDGDVTFYGVYGSCTAVQDWTFDAYWLWLRDARSLNDTNFVWFVEWLENVFDVDDYDVTNLHTIGTRAEGRYGAFDFNGEIAYQFGDAGQVGYVFKPYLYGDDDADFSAWAATLELGYTFETAWTPRVAVGFDYFGGEDNRDLNFVDWLLGFDTPGASVSFNRLFSDKMYSGFIDLNNDLSNAWIARGQVSARPTEKVTVIGSVMYVEAVEPFDAPVHVNVAGFRVPVAPALSFWTTENDSSLFWEGDLFVVYAYSEDLTFTFHYSVLFPEDGLTDGAFSAWNGLVSTQGSDDDVSHYISLESRITF